MCPESFVRCCTASPFSQSGLIVMHDSASSRALLTFCSLSRDADLLLTKDKISVCELILYPAQTGHRYCPT